MEYFPFGETFIEERTDAEYTSYLYNGKELDEETGLYYYGARYYDPRISMFYGVDPLAEKYSFQTPYAYAANNPVILIDIQGMGPGDSPDVGGFIWNSMMEFFGVENPMLYAKSSAHFVYPTFEQSLQRFMYDYSESNGGVNQNDKEVMASMDPYFNMDLNSWGVFETGNVESTSELNIGANASLGVYGGFGIAKDDRGNKQNYLSLGGGISPGIGLSFTYNKTSFYERGLNFSKHNNLGFGDLQGFSVGLSGSYFGAYAELGTTINSDNPYLYLSKGASLNLGINPLEISTGMSGSLFGSYTWLLGEPYSTDWKNYSINLKQNLNE